MPKGKSNLSKQTRAARKVASKRKQLTPEQLKEVRTKVAAQKALKRSLETPEEHAARCRRTANDRRQQRDVKRRREKQMRQRAILSAIEDRKITKNEETHFEIVQNQLANGERIMMKLKKKLQDDNTEEEGNTVGNNSQNRIDSLNEVDNMFVITINSSDSVRENHC